MRSHRRSLIGLAPITDSNLDLQHMLDECGITSLNTLTPTDDVARSVRELATRAQGLDEVARAQCQALAADHLAAHDVPAGRRAVAAAFRMAARSSTLSTRVALAPDIEELPNGVVLDTDLANAHRLVRDQAHDLRYVPALGWFVWDGHRWTQDRAAAWRRAHEVARALELSSAALRFESLELNTKGLPAAAAQTQALAEKYHRWAERSQRTERLSAFMRLAQDLEGIGADPALFDSNPWLLNCPNGTLDLETGDLRAHNRNDLMTHLLSVRFDPDASAPRFEAFLEQVLPDTDVRSWLRRLIGYCLTGHTTEQCIIILHGAGANGKSTLLEIVRAMFGELAAATSMDAFLIDQGRSASQYDVPRLVGKRFVTATESGEDRRLDEQLIKRITGGDRMTARRLYGEPFEFVPSFKLWVAVNDRPEIRGIDNGIWRRILQVPFEKTFGANARDPNLLSTLRGELPGILAWAVRGCREWQQQGLNTPDTIISATSEWRADANVVGQFINERCVRAETERTASSTLYLEYCHWSKTEGHEALSQKAFARRLRQLGFQPTRDGKARGWTGLRIHSDA